MSEELVLYSKGDGTSLQIQRYLAVKCALELIRADCLGGKGGQIKISYLEEHFENLSVYADKIQDALKERS